MYSNFSNVINKLFSEKYKCNTLSFVLKKSDIMWKCSVIQFPRILQRYYCSVNITKKDNLNIPDKQNSKTKPTINYNELKYETKVPLKPIEDNIPENTEEITIDNKTIQLLERLSLVDLDSKEALRTLKDSIQFGNKITNINTDGIEPLYTVLENEQLYLRDDQVTEGDCKEDIIRNAKVIEEDYFVAPPGNIPLEQEEKKFE